MCVIFYFIVLFAIEMNSYSDFEAAGCGMRVSFRFRQCCNNT